MKAVKCILFIKRVFKSTQCTLIVGKPICALFIILGKAYILLHDGAKVMRIA